MHPDFKSEHITIWLKIQHVCAYIFVDRCNLMILFHATSSEVCVTDKIWEGKKRPDFFLTSFDYDCKYLQANQHEQNQKSKWSTTSPPIWGKELVIFGPLVH